MSVLAMSVLTMRVLSMRVLTMSVLTMSVLTMRVLTMRVLTMSVPDGKVSQETCRVLLKLDIYVFIDFIRYYSIQCQWWRSITNTKKNSPLPDNVSNAWCSFKAVMFCLFSRISLLFSNSVHIEKHIYRLNVTFMLCSFFKLITCVHLSL